MKLSIIVPAHNEEKRLPPMLDAYAAHFIPKYEDAVEFIVVVNGSADRTAERVREYAAHHSQVKCMEITEAIGKGGAVMRGFEAAEGDLIGFADADGATPPEAFEDLVEHIGEADCIIASRRLPGAVVDPPQPLRRRIASRLFNGMVRILFGISITDTQCGAKLLKRAACKAILPAIGVTRWAFDVDLLFKLRRAGFRIAERPTVWRDIGGSQLRIVRASTEMFIAMVRLRLLYSPFRWVVSLYDIISGPKPHRIQRRT